MIKKDCFNNICKHHLNNNSCNLDGDCVAEKEKVVSLPPLSEEELILAWDSAVACIILATEHPYIVKNLDLHRVIYSAKQAKFIAVNWEVNNGSNTNYSK